MFVGGKEIPTELKKDEAELKDDVLYDDAERDGKFTVICKGAALPYILCSKLQLWLKFHVSIGFLIVSFA